MLIVNNHLSFFANYTQDMTQWFFFPGSFFIVNTQDVLSIYSELFFQLSDSLIIRFSSEHRYGSKLLLSFPVCNYNTSVIF